MEIDEEKMKRLMAKQEAHMIEVAEELLDDEIKEKMEEKIKRVFSRNGIPLTIMSLQAFYEGLVLGLAASREGNGGDEMAFMIVAFTRLYISQKKKAVSDKADDAMKGGV